MFDYNLSVGIGLDVKRAEEDLTTNAVALCMENDWKRFYFNLDHSNWENRI